jgi:hypothetical protein
VTIEELHRTVVEGFQRIDDRLAGHDERFETVEARIREEGETTRRHFNVMVEKIEAPVRIVAEGRDHLRTIVDNHEARLQSVEKLL